MRILTLMCKNKLKKMWLLCCLSLLAVSTMAQRPDTPADYGCASIGWVRYDEYSDEELTVEGWTKIENGVYVSDEVDVSRFQNPVVVAMNCFDDMPGKPITLEKLYVSADGVTFSEYTCSTSGLNAIPKTTKKVKVKIGDYCRTMYLLIGEKWSVKTSKDYKQELVTKLVMGKDSLDSYGRHVYKSVPVDGDSCHHQMAFSAKVNPVVFDGETQESFLEHAILGVRMYSFETMLASWDYDYEVDVAVTVTFTCGGEVVQSTTQTKKRFNREESNDWDQSVLYAMVPRKATDVSIKLEWNSRWSEYNLYDDPETGEKKWVKIEKITTSSPTLTAYECHKLARETSQLTLSTNPDHWFDYDGDGIKEWYAASTDNRFFPNTISKFKADLLSQYPMIEKIGSFDGWINYGHDEHIDAYSTKAIYKLNENNAEEVLSIPDEGSSTPTLRPLDFNNDGKPDFWKGKQYDATATTGEVLTLSGDGTFVSELISLMTAREYYDYKKANGGGHDLGFGFGSVSGSKPTPGANGSSFAQIDLNNDGYPDFIDYPSGYYLLNAGDGRFVIDRFGGTVAIRDFNNDGLNDIFLYDEEAKELSVQIQRSGEEPAVQKLYSGLICSKPIWIRDFDKDGDLDILAAFNSEDNHVWGDGHYVGGDTYLLMFENNGKGTFKRHENFIEGKVNFTACTDYNADGNYELLGRTDSEDEHYESGKWIYDSYIWSCPISGLTINTKCELIATEQSLGNVIMPANIDNSGLTRLVFSDRMLTLSEVRNSRPHRPTAPKVSYNASTGEVYVAWERGTDKETPQLDLTYELRIGTAPDKGDILYAYATADGSRLNMLDGNCGYSTYRRLNASGWPEGTIYVSVQTIDDGKMGSEFSPYTTFEKKEPAGSFIVQNVENAAIGDEFELILDRKKETGSTYSWSLGDGVITKETDNSWTVTFPTAGEKELTLTIVSASGNRSAITRTITVAGVRAEFEEDLNYGIPNAAFDMDLDGKTEVLDGRFYEGDEEGTYTTVKRMFNSQIDLYDRYCKVVDLNNDGLADVVSDSKMLLNEGDKSMTVSSVDDNETYSLTADFDNDGFIDRFSSGTIHRNGGDYVTFTEVTTIPDAAWAADFNGDGMPDLLCSNKDVLINKGNFDFERDENVLPAGALPDRSGYVVCFDDFDGNGGLDMAWTTAYSVFQGFVYSDTLMVRWSDGSSDVILAPSGYRFSFVTRNTVDLDNNGCRDLVVSLDENNAGLIVYFNPDHSYRVERNKYLANGNLLAYQRTDGLTGIDSYILHGAGNEAPTAPSRLRASQNSKFVTIEWNSGSDKETPAAALRYNISIKHKGAEGESAYFMSPLNGGVNGVAVPSDKKLLTSTRITIPVESIPAGEYEVMVQSVDGRWMQSDFSNPLTFTVTASGAFDLPSATMVGKTESVRIFAGVDAKDIDFGDGAEVVSSNSQSVEVRWLTEGTKTVVCGEFSSTIHVHPALNAAFTLPDEILIGTKVRIACDNAHNSKWELVTFPYPDRPEFVRVSPIPQDKKYYLRPIDDTTVEFTFSGYTWDTGFALRHTVSAEYGSDVYEVKPNYVAMSSATELDLVSIDNDGHYTLNWSVPAELAPKVTGVNIYKETSTYGQFEQIATLGAEANAYADITSMPAIKAERYAISYALTYGETQMSTPHMPMHLMINRGAGEGWNLCWNRYEGRDIARYRILRGTSPESLQFIAEVAGSNSSYSDLAAPAGTGFYAVEIIADAPQAAPAGKRVSAASRVSRSNVVSTDEAGMLTPATSIAITSTGADFTINGMQVDAIQLLATVYPVEATMRTVDWMVMDGADVVTVSSRGLVSALQDGTAVVRATATDGSGVYAEVTISVNNITGIEDVNAGKDPAERPNDIYTLQGILVKRDAQEADIRRLASGIYIIAGRKVLVK